MEAKTFLIIVVINVIIISVFSYLYSFTKGDYVVVIKDFPIITIAILACNRYNYLNQTLNALYQHLDLYEKDVDYNILYFDQGTTERYEIIDKYKFSNVFLFNPSGMELSFNVLYSYLYSEYVFILEEDWVVHKDVEKEIFYPSFIKESILILSQTERIYGVIIREIDNFEIMENITITTELGNHTLFIGLLKLKFAYTNGASIYKTKVLKKLKIYYGEKEVSDFFLCSGYRVGFTYKGRKGRIDDIHDQYVMDHIGFHTSKSAICSIPLY